MHLARRTIVACTAFASLVVSSRALHADDAPATKPAVVEPADFHKVKDAMPKTLTGLARTNATGQRSKLGDAIFVTAEAEYGKDEGDAPKTAKLTTMDYGTADMAKGMQAGLATDIDQESDKEYTRTTDLQGRRALITYNTEDKRGSVQTFAGDRMIVAFETHGMTDDEFKKAIGELPLKALDALVTGK